MAQTAISCQTILKPTSNIPADFITNTMHFVVDYSDDTNPVPPDRSLIDQCNEVGNALVAMYELVKGALGGLQTTGHIFKFVDILGPKPQYPILERNWDFSSGITTDQLPSEVAIVGSFEAQQQAGTPQASRRNRIYFGPLSSATVGTDGRIDDGIRAGIATAMKGLSDASDGVGLNQWAWVVWSPKMQQWAVVNNGYVDNAFDTQRRRGVKSTVRSIWEA